MNTPVKYELAKLLKEKGFDEPTLLCYDKCDMLASYAETVFKPKNYNTSGYVKSAPTIAEVVMWLYEKHGVWISVNMFSERFIFSVSEKVDTWGFDKLESEIRYNSPTEAYEVAIEHTLNNLIR